MSQAASYNVHNNSNGHTNNIAVGEALQTRMLAFTTASASASEHSGLASGHMLSWEQRPFVLVVDDDKSISQMLCDVLREAGYRVIVASNGRAAIAVARREHPALVLTDRMMPEVDGVELARRLRTSAVTRDIPIVLMSSTYPDVEELNGIPFLAKPFEIDDLLAVVATYVYSRERWPS